MPKNILRDIMTTEERRTIRQVPLPHGRNERHEETILYEEEILTEERPTRNVVRNPLLWLAVFVFLGFFGFVVAASFSGATVTVTPRSAVVQVSGEFVAGREAGAKIGFTAITLTESADLSIPADTIQNVSERASGKIVIYNNYSEKPQRLIKNTRFTSAGGLVYRIAESVIVPGIAKTGGKSVPGSLEVVVFADAPGDEYNISLSDFTIPGFKNDAARYAAFYARAKTPLAGGFEGVMKAPSESKLHEARRKLERDLAERIRKKASGSVPEGFILYDDAIAITYDSPLPDVKGDSAKVRDTATATLYLLRRSELERAIAAEVLPSQADVPAMLPDLDKLHFSFNEEPLAGTSETSLRFRLSGTTRVVWLFEKDTLRSALLGKRKADLASVLSSFPTIEKVDLVMRPFWKQSFPVNPGKVKIEEAEVSRSAAQEPETP